ncbi:hypothetical protein J6590_010517 [Homalodisca vitripennis]|nr:hypothetical protein J6590_010517 [Homalodisca vitripennis]
MCLARPQQSDSKYILISVGYQVQACLKWRQSDSRTTKYKHVSSGGSQTLTVTMCLARPQQSDSKYMFDQCRLPSTSMSQVAAVRLSQ